MNLRNRKRAADIAAVTAAAVFFAAAVVLEFALVGYTVLAMVCAGIGASVALFWALCRFGGRKAGIAARVFAALLAAGAAVFVCLEIPIVQAARTDAKTADYLIVLGAGVDGYEPSISLKNRLDAAVEFLNRNTGCIAVVTGGQGKGEYISEAEAMRRYLTEAGIQEERIIKEEQASSTEENIRYSLALIEDPEEQEIAIASSEYHLYRAKLIAKEQGVECTGVAGRTDLFWLRINYFIREALAVAWMTVC